MGTRWFATASYMGFARSETVCWQSMSSRAILFKLARSGDCHTTNRKGIERMMANVGFTITDSRQIRGMIYTVTGKKETR